MAERVILGKTAIIDIDNTLWQFSDAFYEELRKIDRNVPTPEHWISYETIGAHCSAEEFVTAIHAIHCHQDSDRYQPYPEARGFLSSLRSHGFHVIIASHRTPATRPPTERWLAKHGLLNDELHLSLDKTVLFPGADIVVDDSPVTLEKAIECGVRAAGLSFPWNRSYANNGFRLFHNLSQVLEYILGKEESRSGKE